MIILPKTKRDYNRNFKRITAIITFDSSDAICYYFYMIKSFSSKETQKIWEGQFSKKLPPDIQRIARRKLRMLNNSRIINDLTVPPANNLEQLKGNRKGQYSIRINDQWRICFTWKNEDCHDVEIVDYH